MNISQQLQNHYSEERPTDLHNNGQIKPASSQAYAGHIQIRIALKIIEEVYNQNMKQKIKQFWQKVKLLCNLTISLKQLDTKPDNQNDDQVFRDIFFDAIQTDSKYSKASNQQSVSKKKVGIFGQLLEQSIKKKNFEIKPKQDSIILLKPTSYIEQTTQQKLGKKIRKTNSKNIQYERIDDQDRVDFKRAKLLNRISSTLKQAKSNQNAQLVLRVKNIQKIVMQIANDRQHQKPNILNQNSKKQAQTSFKSQQPSYVNLVLHQIKQLKKQVQQIKFRSQLHLNLIQRTHSNLGYGNYIRMDNVRTPRKRQAPLFVGYPVQIKGKFIDNFSRPHIKDQSIEMRVKYPSNGHQSIKKQKQFRIQFQANNQYFPRQFISQNEASSHFSGNTQFKDINLISKRQNAQKINKKCYTCEK